MAAALSAKETAAMAAMKSEGTGEEEGEDDDGRKKSGRARVASNKALAHLDEPLPASKRKPKVGLFTCCARARVGALWVGKRPLSS